MPDDCMFCGDPADSGEDLISVWMRPIIEETRSDPNARGVLTLIDWTNPTAPTIVDVWPTKMPIIKRKIVCISCNSRWMSRIENSAKPLLIEMIHGNAIELDASDRQKVANWLGLKAVTAYWIQSGRRFAGEWGHIFNKTRSIPDRWSARIGKIADRSDLNMHSARMTLTPKKIHPLLPISITRETFFFTFTLGHFMGQVFGAHVVVGSHVAPGYFSAIAPQLVVDTEAPQRLNQDLVSWPPPNWLTAEQSIKARLHPGQPEP